MAKTVTQCRISHVCLYGMMALCVFILTLMSTPLSLKASGAETGASAETPVPSPAEEENAKSTEEYWTQDRMREAKPMPMPSPENLAPGGRDQREGGGGSTP